MINILDPAKMRVKNMVVGGEAGWKLGHFRDVPILRSCNLKCGLISEDIILWDPLVRLSEG